MQFVAFYFTAFFIFGMPEEHFKKPLVASLNLKILSTSMYQENEWLTEPCGEFYVLASTWKKLIFHASCIHQADALIRSWTWVLRTLYDLEKVIHIGNWLLDGTSLKKYFYKFHLNFYVNKQTKI